MNKHKLKFYSTAMRVHSLALNVFFGDWLHLNGGGVGMQFRLRSLLAG